MSIVIGLIIFGHFGGVKKTMKARGFVMAYKVPYKASYKAPTTFTKKKVLSLYRDMLRHEKYLTLTDKDYYRSYVNACLFVWLIDLRSSCDTACDCLFSMLVVCFVIGL